MVVCFQCPRPALAFPTTSLQFDKYSACLLLLIRQITLPKDLGTLRCLQRTHYFGAHKVSIGKISQICASPFVLWSYAYCQSLATLPSEVSYYYLQIRTLLLCSILMLRSISIGGFCPFALDSLSASAASWVIAGAACPLQGRTTRVQLLWKCIWWWNGRKRAHGYLSGNEASANGKQRK